MAQKILACFVFLSLVPLAAATDQPSGLWVQKQGDHELQFDFSTKDTLKMSASHGDKGVTVTCSYTIKDGRIKAKITEIDERGINIKEQLPVGTEFNFVWETKDDTATLSDVKGEQNADHLKQHLEGKYERKK
jgi:hypothetical protein